MSASLLYSEVEEDLRATVRGLLAKQGGWPKILANPGVYDVELWRSLAGTVGCAGLAIPQKWGGAGASWREVAVLAEELGQAVARVPYLGGVAATAALLTCEAGDLLEQVASGERIPALVAPFSTPVGSAPPGSFTVAGEAASAAVSGTITTVADALVADLLVLAAGGSLWAVEAGLAERTAVTSLDLTRPLCDISLSNAPARLLADGAVAEKAWDDGLVTAAGILASEQLGIAQWCLNATVDYVTTRHQFGRAIGSFQALKHRLAALWVDLAQARAVARAAAGCLADGENAEAADTAIAVSVAQAFCSEVAVQAAETCVQLHGGIGFTWEHPAHLYLKRAKSASIALGTATAHRARLADLVALPLS